MADHAEISAKRGAIHDRFLTVVSSSPFMCPSPAIAKIRGGRYTGFPCKLGTPFSDEVSH